MVISTIYTNGKGKQAVQYEYTGRKAQKPLKQPRKPAERPLLPLRGCVRADDRMSTGLGMIINIR
jgi:hypothetical protein